MNPNRKLVLRLLLLVTWVVAFFIFHLKFYKQEILIKELPQTYRFFSDSAFGSTSTCNYDQIEDTIIFNYQLVKKKGQYPFANHVSILEEAIDVSGYDNFEYTLKGDHPDKLRLFLVMEIPGDSLIPTHTIEHLNKAYSTEYEIHKIPLQDFQYHEYWINSQNINENELGDFNFTNMKALVFGSAANAKVGRNEHIAFHSVKFTKTTFWPYFVFGFVFIFMFLFWWIRGLFANNEEVVSVNYTPQDEKNANNFPSPVQFISENYMNPIISATMVCEKLAISETKLSYEIKAETSLSFKLLLNQLRIEEAKRLLIETNFLISKIAVQVGYENVTNFNRVFKKEENMSPSEYRKLYKPSDNG